ncbi:hypothetical protein GCM10010185_30550 [Saccharothrix coeruleofusca]|uniref:Uncharacterized protein n=1 Tax=Saccharothrix coeruleofusca TaxID=33919 RepID=A0A918EEG6_9PSEU|nr:hypothetical protein GCM10010185_30550 [Saccharothrix coeruleofusca]
MGGTGHVETAAGRRSTSCSDLDRTHQGNRADQLGELAAATASAMRILDVRSSPAVHDRTSATVKEEGYFICRAHYVTK